MGKITYYSEIRANFSADGARKWIRESIGWNPRGKGVVGSQRNNSNVCCASTNSANATPNWGSCKFPARRRDFSFGRRRRRPSLQWSAGQRPIKRRHALMNRRAGNLTSNGWSAVTMRRHKHGKCAPPKLKATPTKGPDLESTTSDVTNVSPSVNPHDDEVRQTIIVVVACDYKDSFGVDEGVLTLNHNRITVITGFQSCLVRKKKLDSMPTESSPKMQFCRFTWRIRSIGCCSCSFRKMVDSTRNRQENGRLTGDGEGGVARTGDAGRVAGHAPVDAGVVVLAAVRHFEEEQVAVGQQHAVAALARRPTAASRVRDHLAVAVPWRAESSSSSLWSSLLPSAHRHWSKSLLDWPCDLFKGSERVCHGLEQIWMDENRLERVSMG